MKNSRIFEACIEKMGSVNPSYLIDEIYKRCDTDEQRKQVADYCAKNGIISGISIDMLRDNEIFREALMKNLELVHRNLKNISKEQLAILENDPEFRDRLTTVREEFDREEGEKGKTNAEIQNPEQTEEKEELPQTVDETKFAEIYGKAKGRIKEAFGKIKSFFQEKVFGKNNDTNDTNEQR